MANQSDDLNAVRRGDDLSIGAVVDLVKTYAKQETLGPLKGAGRWLAAGTAGALLLGIGLALVLLGVLRLIQTEFANLARGGWSFTPYVIVLAACVAVIVFAITRINKSSLNKEPD